VGDPLQQIDWPVRYLRAAGHRFDAAQTLVQFNHFLDAAYLAGYVAEFSLKAVYMRRSGKVAVEKDFKIHDIQKLRDLVLMKGSIPANVRENLSQIEMWKPEWRYTIPDQNHDREYAESFLASAKVVLNWAIREVDHADG
jgi:HEPN domain-containing protein